MTDILDLFKKSHAATIEYVIPRIKSHADREAYMEAVIEINTFLQQNSLISSFDLLRHIELMVDLVPKRKFKFSLFASQRKYYLMSITHALDIIQSLQTRFVHGGERVYLFPCKYLKKVV